MLLASGPDVETIAQTALHAGLQLCGAAVGMFIGVGTAPLKIVDSADGDGDHVKVLQALRQEAFSLGVSADRPGLVRSSGPRGDDYSQELAQKERVESGKTGIGSYLSIPLQSATGELLGTLLYAHSAVDVFVQADESPLALIAAQATLAITKVQLAETLKAQVAEADAVRAEQRATSSRLRDALQAAGMGTWTWEAPTDLMDFDERAGELFGVAAHTPMTREALRKSLVHTDDLAFAPADLREVGRLGGQYRTEYRLALPGGEQRWVSVRGNAQKADDGEMLGMIGTVQDVTLQRMQEETLRTSEKLAATGRMAATIAHEINNPLEAVTNLIYLAKTDPETPESVSRMLEVADGELARVSQIAQQTLGFYRDTTRPVTVDLNELLTAVVELFDRKLTGKGLKCTLDLEPGLSIVGLKGEIRQVVANLLVNAIDASQDRGGRIRIRGRHRSRREGRGIAVLICDEGEGIPIHVSRKLFSPFVTTKRSTGTGLGLWVTRGMVEKHGGSVSFRSRTTDPSGTVFRVYLPQSGLPTGADAVSTMTIQ